MIYTCIVLALYQDIQEKARNEVNNIYAQLSGDNNGDLPYSEHYDSFLYLVAVMVREIHLHRIQDEMKPRAKVDNH